MRISGLQNMSVAGLARKHRSHTSLVETLLFWQGHRSPGPMETASKLPLVGAIKICVIATRDALQLTRIQ